MNWRWEHHSSDVSMLQHFPGPLTDIWQMNDIKYNAITHRNYEEWSANLRMNVISNNTLGIKGQSERTEELQCKFHSLHELETARKINFHWWRTAMLLCTWYFCRADSLARSSDERGHRMVIMAKGGLVMAAIIFAAYTEAHEITKEGTFHC